MYQKEKKMICMHEKCMIMWCANLPTHKVLTRNHTPKCMKHCQKWKCDAMNKHIGSFKQNPTQKFHKYLINFEKPQKLFKNKKPITNISSILKNPKNFSKTQNLGLNVWNAWRKRENKIIPVKKGSLYPENQLGLRFRERERSVWEVKRQVYVERDRRKWSLKLRWIYL